MRYITKTAILNYPNTETERIATSPYRAAETAAAATHKAYWVQKGGVIVKNIDGEYENFVVMSGNMAVGAIQVNKLPI